MASVEMPDGELIEERYQILEDLGRGGSAIVQLALDREAGEHVAIKRMRSSVWDLRARRRFLKEARVLAALRHPNLIEVYDASEDARGTPFITMRRLKGETLEEVLGRTPMDPGETLAWCFPILGALAVAHDRGIVHRDIKPSNIFIEAQTSGEPQPVLIDFGIARSAGGDGGAAAETTPGVVMGTPAYMAPEYASGRTPSPAADVWSVGVVLFRSLSGALPFARETPMATLLDVVQNVAPRLSETAPDLSLPVALAVDRALRPLETRYPTARAFAEALVHAAVAGGVQLPMHPDPIGLPDWDRWVAEAKSDTTTVRAAAVASAVPPPAWRVTPYLLGAGLFVGVACAVLFATGEADSAPIGGLSPSPASGAFSTQLDGGMNIHAPAAPALDRQDEVPPTSRASSADEVPTAEPPTPEPPAPEPRPRPRRRPRRVVERPPSTIPATEPVEQLPEIVTSWDL